MVLRGKVIIIFYLITFTGFHFLNWDFFFFNNLFIGTSYALIKYQKNSLKLLVKSSNNINTLSLVKRINLQIDSWRNNFNFLDFFWDLSNEMDVFLYKLLWSWVKRRHPRRTNTWIYSKYWIYLFGKWRFFSKDILNGNIYLIKSHIVSKSFIFRIPNSICIFNSYNKFKINDIWFKKMKNNFKGLYGLLYYNQRGICLICKRLLSLNSLNEFSILQLSKNKCLNNVFVSNIVLVHKSCTY